MKKLKVFISLISVLSLVLVGCGGDTAKENQKVDGVKDVVLEDKDSDMEKKPEVDSEGDEDDNSSDSFGKIREMKEYYYEVEATSTDGTSFNSKFWFSGNKTRIDSISSETEQISTMIIDEDEKISYMYTPASNQAIKMNHDPSQLDDEDESEINVDYIDSMKDMDDDGNVDVENGTFEGELVKIVTTEIEGNTNKVWVSKKTGFPLKSEFYTDGKLEMVSLLKNFNDKPIDPSVFTLPEGVQIVDMTK